MKKTTLRSPRPVALVSADIRVSDLPFCRKNWLFDCQVRRHSPQVLSICALMLSKLEWFLQLRGHDLCGLATVLSNFGPGCPVSIAMTSPCLSIMDFWKVSTASCVTNCLTARSSFPWPKRRHAWKHISAGTMRDARTVACTMCRLLPLQEVGGRNNRDRRQSSRLSNRPKDSHRPWYIKRGKGTTASRNQSILPG